jgi:hypothetical protein
LLLGLLPWLDPASAQQEHSLTVSIHQAVRHAPSRQDIEQILQRASNLLKSNESDVQNDCDVTFKLKELNTFSSAPAHIRNADDLEKVHSVDADVKIVQTITFCKNENRPAGFWGCAWRPEGRPKTVIVANTVPPNLRHIVWTHEYGHTTGLEHRERDNSKPLDPLMTACGIESFTVLVNKYECDCIRAGPRMCSMQDKNLQCSSSSSTRLRSQTD